MKNSILRFASVLFALILAVNVFVFVPAVQDVSASEESAPVILNTEYYDNARKTGGSVPESDLSGTSFSENAGGYGAPYTPTVYRAGRCTQVSVYVKLDDGYTAEDYSFRWICGVVDQSGDTPVCRDRYVTRANTLSQINDEDVTVTEGEYNGEACIVCTYTLSAKPSFDIDRVTEEMADGVTDLPQLSRIYCQVERAPLGEDGSSSVLTNESNAFYVAETYSKTSSRDLVAFMKKNYDLGLLTPSVYYKDANGTYTDVSDGKTRRPEDSLELGLYVPDLADVPHVTGMTAEAMNSNYSAYNANSPDMYLEWYAANGTERGDGYQEVYLGTTSYGQHELFHEWYYQDRVILGTDTTYSVIDELKVQYQYVYCKLRIEITFGTVPGFISLTTDYLELPGFTTEEEPDVLLGDVTGDGKVTARDTIALKKYNVNPSSVNINLANADVNGDGRVNAKDVIALKKMVAGVL